ncbi:MAG: Yip1 family protein [Georgfuchsia sp.]
MSLITLPKMMVSDNDGWSDIVRMHPTATKLMLYFVMPMSLIPPLMYAYAQLVHPGVVFALVLPPLTGGEALLVGAMFFLVELAMVLLMAAYIQELGGVADIHPDYAKAFTLAAIAPTPLWLSALALFVPSLWFNVLVVVAAWLGSVALVRHGVRALLRVRSEENARRLTKLITVTGAAVWIGLMLLLTMILGMVLGWR